jgi:nucleoid-associated protein YgaU
VEPADGLLAALRLIVVVGLAYLLLVTLLLAGSRILRSHAAEGLVDRCTGPTLRRFLRASAGIGVGTVTSLHSLAAGAAPPPVTEPPDPVPAATAEPTADDVTTLTRVEPPEAPGEAAPMAPHPETVTTAPADTTTTDATDWWTVEPGDHLWRIAEETLLDHRGEAPSLEQTAAYWHVVCEANHSRLVDPDNPDLIMPGQRIALPPVANTPGA